MSCSAFALKHSRCTRVLGKKRRIRTILQYTQCSSCSTAKALNNFEAAQLLQSLYPDKNAHKLNKKQRRKLVEEASSIYQQIDEQQTKSLDVIHKLLKLCLHMGHSHRVLDIWDDIQNSEKSKLEYSLLVKCCIDSNHIEQCLQVLRWMESCDHYKLNIHDKLIARLITKCSGNHKQIKLIHRLIDKGLIVNNNTMIKTALINAYGKLNNLDTAQSVFDSVADSDMDIVCISAMMKCFIQFHEYHKALELYDAIDTIQNDKLKKDDICHNLALQASSKLANVSKRSIMEHEINLNTDNVKALTSLIHAYKNNPDEAWRIFNAVDDANKDAVLMSTMMKVLMENGAYSETLELFQRYQDKEAIRKNHVCNLFALKACTKLKDYEAGKRIHSENVNSNNVQLKNALIAFYSACDEAQSAAEVFDSIVESDKDIITYTCMMQAYLKQNEHDKVLELYGYIQQETKLEIDTLCHLCAMKAYANLGNVQEANNIFVTINEEANDLDSKLALIEFYGNNDDTNNALNVYKSIPNEQKNPISTNAILSVFLNQFKNQRLIDLYLSIDNNCKDAVSHSLALKACANANNLDKGKMIHDYLKNNRPGFLSVHFKTQLIDFYGACKDVEAAKEVFHSIPNDERDIVCIGAMMKCFINNDLNEQAIKLYDNLHENTRNLAVRCLVIRAYTNLEHFESAQEIVDFVQSSMSENDRKAQEFLSAMIYLYGQWKNIEQAWSVYHSVYDYQKDIVMVNNMLFALQNNKLYKPYSELFEELLSDELLDHLKPNIITFTNALIACTNGTLLEFGMKLHDALNSERYKWMLHDVGIQVNLINMYNKCGKLDVCKQIFFELTNDEMFRSTQHIAAWNAMLQAYGDHKDLQSAEALYKALLLETCPVSADSNSYSIVINIYGHFGMMEEAMSVWESDIKDEKIQYDNHVVGSLVHVLSRKGLLDKAQRIIELHRRYQSNNATCS